MKPKTEFIEMMVDGMPLEVKATPYMFNDETRYRVSFNGSPVHIFAYDEELKYYRAIDSGSAEIPDNIDEAIGRRLHHKLAA